MDQPWKIQIRLWVDHAGVTSIFQAFCRLCCHLFVMFSAHSEYLLRPCPDNSLVVHLRADVRVRYSYCRVPGPCLARRAIELQGLLAHDTAMPDCSFAHEFPLKALQGTQTGVTDTRLAEPRGQMLVARAARGRFCTWHEHSRQQVHCPLTSFCTGLSLPWYAQHPCDEQAQLQLHLRHA